ncbi:MAG: threonine--tRNA ligase [Nitrospinota bacterium]|nr:threonine--tRNA ligase [Nitrospinota bacterium]MDH5679615.1 threonine--tRNA ligase [Nitrospinota bacterium]
MTDIHAARHSAAHIMAEAIQQLHPGAQFAYGPETDDGFYYDVKIPDGSITEEDLPKIEKAMKKIIKARYKFTMEEVPRQQALELFAGQKYKVLTLENQLADQETVSVYRQGAFTDLCRGPHVEHTGQISAFKIDRIAGSYWLGDSKNEPLQRVYGLCFSTKDELAEYVTRMEEAKKRDHRLISKQLKLYSWHDEGPGFPFMLPHGRVLFNLLIDYNRAQNNKRGYVEIHTPQMLVEDLWATSGHTDYYRDNMYFSQVDDRQFAIKPMNCPGGVLVYKEERRSYRELPMRVAEFGLVHRHELSGVLHGLFRARAFTQDDAHIYCAIEDMEKEIQDVVALTLETYRDFGFNEYVIYVATRPEKAIGEPEAWDRATEILKRALAHQGLDYRIKEGEGAFYGPKIEFNVKDSIGRQWQLGTAQLDFFLPQRFGMEYIGHDSAPHTPVMLHRAIFGSLERFIGILIENTMGAFPPWLAPLQAVVLPITDDQNEYAIATAKRLREAGLRAEADVSSERLQKKIRNAQMMKTPHMLVAGGREAEAGAVAVRLRTGEDLGAMPLEDYIAGITAQVAARSWELWKKTEEEENNGQG